MIGVLGGLIGLGGAEFRLPLLVGAFRFRPLEAIILNKTMSPVVVAVALVSRTKHVPLQLAYTHRQIVLNLLAGSLLGAWCGASWATRMRGRHALSGDCRATGRHCHRSASWPSGRGNDTSIVGISVMAGRGRCGLCDRGHCGAHGSGWRRALDTHAGALTGTYDDNPLDILASYALAAEASLNVRPPELASGWPQSQSSRGGLQ